MSDDLKEHSPSDDVELGPLFDAITSFFKRVVRLIRLIFESIVNGLVFCLKVVIDNYKWIVGVSVISFVLGFIVEKQISAVYSSQLLVRPYFESKYQLTKDLGYYNTLIGAKNYKELSKVFDISEEDAASLLYFEINWGPESENEKLLAYDNFIKLLDSTSANSLPFNEFIANRNFYSGILYEIRVEASKNDVFKSLEPTLKRSFENDYSIRQKQKRDTLIGLQKSNILSLLTTVDSLRQVYVSVLKEESTKETSKITLGQGLSIDSRNNSKTREFELLNKEIELRTDLLVLEEMEVREDTYYDIVSEFSKVGSRVYKIEEKYRYIFPMLGMALLTLIFVINLIVKFVRSHEK